ncbi:retrovirus-related pol polyprotein from transposon TNT 1-94 [Tanacetum coccineum]
MFSQNMDTLEQQLTKETIHDQFQNAFRVLKTQFEKIFSSVLIKPSSLDGMYARKDFRAYTSMEPQLFKEIILKNFDFIEDYMLKTIIHAQTIQKRLDDKKLQIQECTVQEVKALDAISEDKAKKSCMAQMFLNRIQLEKQLDKEEFQEIGSTASFKVLETQFQMFIKSRIYLDDEYVDMTRNKFLQYTRLEIPEFHDTLTQHMEFVKKSIDERAQHKRDIGTESKEQDTSSRSGNDAHADDADIRPIYDEEPMVEKVDQNVEQKSSHIPLPAKLTDDKTIELSDQSLESENVCLKKTVAQCQKDFAKLEAHCINLELQMQNNVLKSGQQSQFLKEKGNEAKVKHDIDVIETINIELEHKMATLLKENETLKRHYKEMFDSIKTTRAKNIEHTTSLIATNDKFKAQIQEKGFAVAALKNELRKLTGNSVNTKFAKPSILGKPVGQPLKNQSVVRQPTAFKSERPKISKPRFASQVDVNNDLSKPVTTHHLPKRRESAPAKPHHMIAPRSSRLCSNDIVHNHYLEEAKKKTHEHSRIPRNFSDSKHFVCSTCQKCVFNANHDACGTEFLNKTLHAYFKEEGIEHQTSTPRTPEQNGVVERRNRTLVEAARTMLSASKLPLSFWAEAVATACYTQNRSIIISTHGKTAYHIINDRKPSIKHLHIFGCICYITRDGENLDKMKEKGDPCVMVGYSTQSKGYRVYNKRTRLIVESIHIKFDEIKEMMSDHNNSDLAPQRQEMYVENVSLGLVPQGQKASDYDNSNPVPPRQNVVPTTEKTDLSQKGLEFLFNPLLEEYYNPAHGHAEDNNNDQALNASFQGAEFINPFCTRVQEIGESSSRNIDNTDVHSFQPQSHDYRWTRDYPLEQVRGNPTMPVRLLLEAEEVLRCTARRVSLIQIIQKNSSLQESFVWITATPKLVDELSNFLMSKGFTNSISGGIQFLGDKLVSWMSKKQNCTAMSSAEAEYVALSASCAQNDWYEMFDIQLKLEGSDNCDTA